MFSGSPKGAESSAIIYSLVESVKMNDLSVLDYFNYILRKIPYCITQDDYIKLLPFNLTLEELKSGWFLEGGINYRLRVNPILGRIFGVLLCNEKPISLIEISKKLELSKAAVSIHIRALEKLGYCQRLPKTKNRQNFYILREDYLQNVYKQRIEQEQITINRLSSLLGKTENYNETVEHRISEFLYFNNFIITTQLKSVSEWEEKNDNKR